jgi:cytochrome c-type biogenesis protein CcmH/NrfG
MIVNGACGKAADTGAGQTAATGADEAQLMQRGTNLLYQANDPIGAGAVFRDVLQRNPTHYGAQYQLAVSLDRGGKPREARSLWEKVLKNAEDARDSTTARTARSRLAAPDTASQSAMMALGLDLLYKRNDAAGAIGQFRKVLERNPTHYGATYQLATALDKAGQAAQARQVWEKVLGMAVTYKDDKIAETARSRLR